MVGCGRENGATRGARRGDLEIGRTVVSSEVEEEDGFEYNVHSLR